MGILDKFDLCALFDQEWTDGAGLRRTRDRSRHGIHPLVGDGSAAATMPTWDADRGLYTFDGSDYLTLQQSDDVDDVLANMGSIQDETYCFYFDPWIDSTAAQALINNNASQPMLYIRSQNTPRILRFYVQDASGAEVLDVSGIDDFNGRSILITATRTPSETTTQRIFFDTVLAGSDTDTPRDGSSSSDFNIGRFTNGNYPLVSGTGLRFFGYARNFAITQTQLRMMTRQLRGLL